MTNAQSRLDGDDPDPVDDDDTDEPEVKTTPSVEGLQDSQITDILTYLEAHPTTDVYLACRNTNTDMEYAPEVAQYIRDVVISEPDRLKIGKQATQLAQTKALIREQTEILDAQTDMLDRIAVALEQINITAYAMLEDAEDNPPVVVTESSESSNGLSGFDRFIEYVYDHVSESDALSIVRNGSYLVAEKDGYVDDLDSYNSELREMGFVYDPNESRWQISESRANYQSKKWSENGNSN